MPSRASPTLAEDGSSWGVDDRTPGPGTFVGTQADPAVLRTGSTAAPGRSAGWVDLRNQTADLGRSEPPAGTEPGRPGRSPADRGRDPSSHTATGRTRHSDPVGLGREAPVRRLREPLALLLSHPLDSLRVAIDPEVAHVALASSQEIALPDFAPIAVDEAVTSALVHRSYSRPERVGVVTDPKGLRPSSIDRCLGRPWVSDREADGGPGLDVLGFAYGGAGHPHVPQRPRRERAMDHRARAVARELGERRSVLWRQPARGLAREPLREAAHGQQGQARDRFGQRRRESDVEEPVGLDSEAGVCEGAAPVRSVVGHRLGEVGTDDVPDPVFQAVVVGEERRLEQAYVVNLDQDQRAARRERRPDVGEPGGRVGDVVERRRCPHEVEVREAVRPAGVEVGGPGAEPVGDAARRGPGRDVVQERVGDVDRRDVCRGQAFEQGQGPGAGAAPEVGDPQRPVGWDGGRGERDDVGEVAGEDLGIEVEQLSGTGEVGTLPVVTLVVTVAVAAVAAVAPPSPEACC